MKLKMKALGGLFLFVLTVFSANAQEFSVDISVDRIREDVYILTSDSLQGRRFPGEGREKAARYIANEFHNAGLNPISSLDKSYFQKIPVKKTQRGQTSIKINDKWMGSGWNYSFASKKPFNDSLTLPMKFIGKTKPYMPFGFGDTILHITSKSIAEAMKKIRGVAESNDSRYFAISLPNKEKSTLNLIRNEILVGLKYRYPSGAFGAGTKEPRWLFTYFIDTIGDTKVFLFSDEFTQPLYGQSYAELNKNSEHSGKSKAERNKNLTNLTFKSNFKVETHVGFDENVIGYIEGTDFKDEAIIVCGHYDHLGRQPKGVCYGADDNASGTAGVMELARMCVQAQRNGFEFKRSIVFIAFCAEESGLNGSSFYVENPIFPLEKTALVINMDMIGRSDTPLNKPGYGYFRPIKGEKRNLKKILRSVDEQIDDLNVFFRQSFKEDLMWYMGSDHYPFVKKGIPALVVTTGDHDDYHKPTDTPEKINYQNMANIVKALFVLLTEVAN